MILPPDEAGYPITVLHARTFNEPVIGLTDYYYRSRYDRWEDYRRETYRREDVPGMSCS